MPWRWLICGSKPLLICASVPVTEARQLAFGPQDVLMSGTTPLILSEQNGVKLLEIGDARFVIVGPLLLIGSFGLETPGSTELDYSNLPFGPILISFYPGMTIVHPL